MKQLVPAALLSLLIGGGAAYLISNMGKTDLQTALDQERARLDLLNGAFAEYLANDEKIAYILINKAAESGKCKATTTPSVTAMGGQKLRWNFNIVDASCLDNGERVQIRFKSGSAPTEDPEPSSAAGKKFIKAKVKDIFVGTTLYRYGVWMVPQTGAPYQMEDPELEIVGSLRLKDFILKNPVPQIPAPATPPAPAPPQAPPAKKQ